MRCSPPIPRILVTLPFSLESSFKHHPMSYFRSYAALPPLFTFTYYYSCPKKSEFPSVLLFCVAKSAKPEIKPQNAVLPSQREVMTCMFTLLHKLFASRRGSKETCHFVAALAFIVWCYLGTDLNLHLRISLKFLTFTGHFVP